MLELAPAFCSRTRELPDVCGLLDADLYRAVTMCDA